MFEGLDAVGLAIWLVAFLLSATCHEAAHALAAKLGGDPTAYLAGQVTLNPLPHVRREPFGMLVFPLVSFFMFGWMIGWASAPYDPAWARRHPRRAAVMAAAGPAANVVLLIVAVAGLKFLVATGMAGAAEAGSPGGLDRIVVAASAGSFLDALVRFLGIVAFLNALLASFNLIPLPPLDGAAVVEGLVGRKATRVMDAFRALPMASLVGLVLAWRVFSWVALFVLRGVATLIQS